MGLHIDQARQAGCHRSRSRLQQWAHNHMHTPDPARCTATIIELSDTWVDVVADAVHVGVGLTWTSAFSEGVEGVSVTVAVTGGDVGTSALVDLAWSVDTSVELSDTWVDVVADAVSVRIGLTRTSAFSEGVELVAVTIAVFGRDAVAATEAALVEDVSVTVAIAYRDVAHPHS